MLAGLNRKDSFLWTFVIELWLSSHSRVTCGHVEVNFRTRSRDWQDSPSTAEPEWAKIKHFCGHFAFKFRLGGRSCQIWSVHRSAKPMNKKMASRRIAGQKEERGEGHLIKKRRKSTFILLCSTIAHARTMPLSWDSAGSSHPRLNACRSNALKEWKECNLIKSLIRFRNAH